MTPKEKAKELVDIYIDITETWSFNGINTTNVKNYDLSKQCALIAVDELIKYTPSIDIYPPNYQKLNTGVREYWKKVKIELENL